MAAPQQQAYFDDEEMLDLVRDIVARLSVMGDRLEEYTRDQEMPEVDFQTHVSQNGTERKDE